MIENDNSSGKEINDLIQRVTKMKEEGEKLFKEGQLEKSEKILTVAIVSMTKFKPPKEFSVKSPENAQKGMEILNLLKSLYSNLALVQEYRGKYNESINNSQYILKFLDADHEKSYIRILRVLLILNQLELAKGLSEEIKIKFPNKEQQKHFENLFQSLDSKLKKISRKKEEENSLLSLANSKYIFPAISTIGVGLLIYMGMRMLRK